LFKWSGTLVDSKLAASLKNGLSCHGHANFFGENPSETSPYRITQHNGGEKAFIFTFADVTNVEKSVSKEPF